MKNLKSRTVSPIPDELMPLVSKHAVKLGWSQRRFLAFAIQLASQQCDHLEKYRSNDFVEKLVLRRIGKRQIWRDEQRFIAFLNTIALSKSDIKQYQKGRRYKPGEQFPMPPHFNLSTHGGNDLDLAQPKKAIEHMR